RTHEVGGRCRLRCRALDDRIIRVDWRLRAQRFFRGATVQAREAAAAEASLVCDGLDVVCRRSTPTMALASCEMDARTQNRIWPPDPEGLPRTKQRACGRSKALVPRTRSSHACADRPVANFGFKRGTRIIELLVSL